MGTRHHRCQLSVINENMKKTSAERAERWKACDFGLETKQDAPIKPVKKLSKPSQVKKYNTNNKTSTFRDTNNFYSRVAPKSVSDLAVHPKKIQEVEEWIKLNVLTGTREHSPLLLLSGPTGCGKTNTVTLLCKEMRIAVSEWINPLDQDFESFGTSSQIGNFVEFLTESKWNSLFDTGNVKRVTLVKDFPNMLIRHPEEFFNVLEQCYYQTNYPIIFICTDASSSDINLSRTLFPEEIINKYNIKHISFNACAPSLMKNVIKQAKAVAQENSDIFKQPSAATIDAILASAMGDIRNAINQFYFASLIGTKELPVVINSSQKTGNKRKRNEKATTVQCMSRDENLGLFHGLGRVLNPKRNETGISWRLHYNVEKLVDEFSVQPSIFISFLFENYLKYFGNINDASRAADILSFSVKFLDNWNDRYETLIFGLWVSVSGLMIFNEHKVSKWNQIRGPTKIMQRIPNSSEGVGLKSTDYFYYNLIKRTDTFHKFKTML